VKFESDGFNVPALFSAQQITCAAQFQVKRRDFETRAEIGKFFQRCQASAGDRSNLDVRRDQQVRIGSAVRASHASAQLVELGEPKAVGAIDDNRIAKRNVETVLDDGGGHQNVGLVMHELQHHFFEFSFRHLPVS